MAVRKKCTVAFKAKVALVALSSDRMAERCSEYGVHQTQINTWKRELKDGAAEIFNGETKSDDSAMQKKLHELHAKIGQFTLERDF